MYCANCGSKTLENTRYCEYCGTEQSVNNKDPTARTSHHTSTIDVNITNPPPGPTYVSHSNISPKSKLVLILLWFIFGVMGVHYFYAGRIGMGLLWLVTGGFFGIGWIIDILVILSGSFHDSHGRRIVNL